MVEAVVGRRGRDRTGSHPPVGETSPPVSLGKTVVGPGVPTSLISRLNPHPVYFL